MSFRRVSAGLMFVGALPMAAVAGALNWTVGHLGEAVIFLAIALLLGLWRPTLGALKV